jgi:hypothetical protein
MTDAAKYAATKVVVMVMNPSYEHRNTPVE